MIDWLKSLIRRVDWNFAGKIHWRNDRFNSRSENRGRRFTRRGQQLMHWLSRYATGRPTCPGLTLKRHGKRRVRGFEGRSSSSWFIQVASFAFVSTEFAIRPNCARTTFPFVESTITFLSLARVKANRLGGCIPNDRPCPKRNETRDLDRAY